MELVGKCEMCGLKFGKTRTWQRFCGKECRQAWFAAERKRAVEELRERERRADG